MDLKFGLIVGLAMVSGASAQVEFQRLATFPVCKQINALCDDDQETSAEIIGVSTDGNILVYSDSPGQQIGFVDIQDPANPQPNGVVSVGGEPTSLAVFGNYVLVAVNTSRNYVDSDGELAIIDLNSHKQIATLPLGGQPDSIALSPDKQFAAIAIENERDEDKNDGALPQLPAGWLSVIKLQGNDPSAWQVSKVELTGLADIAGEDPEPEYVSINDENIAVITLQENNHIALVDLNTLQVIKHFSAGYVNLDKIDTQEEKPMRITLDSSLDNVAREPDGVVWIDNTYFAVANEGDWHGGSRSISIFNRSGDLIWDSGNLLDHLAVRYGQYPDKRSGNKGNEPENVSVGRFGGQNLLFVNSERANMVTVFNIDDPRAPIFKQVLSTGVGPEGAYAIPNRDLFVVASEIDSRKKKIRSAINLYSYGETQNHRHIQSENNEKGLPISWGALSGLAIDQHNPNILYAVDDSFYASNHIFTIRTDLPSPTITAATTVTDLNDVLASHFAYKDGMINSDKTINLDLEGIDYSDDGFWLVSEGRGTVGDQKRPQETLNLLLKTDKKGVIKDVVTLPEQINDTQLRFGFEGVAQDSDGSVVIAIQRAWGDDQYPKLARYNPQNQTWQFFKYPLDPVASQHGGWVGLSDIAALGNGEFLVLERDNQAGPDAAIKRIYQVDLKDITSNGTLNKKLYRDLLDDLKVDGGQVLEKIEGLAVDADFIYLINDNDGVDDSNGETLLLRIPRS